MQSTRSEKLDLRLTPEAKRTLNIAANAAALKWGPPPPFVCFDGFAASAATVSPALSVTTSAKVVT